MELLSKSIENNVFDKSTFKQFGNLSPDLSWTDVPKNAVSLALTMQDVTFPSPQNTLLTAHLWILYNIPAGVTSLVAGESAGKVGKNLFGDAEYWGISPPGNTPNEIRIVLYALNAEISSNEQTPLDYASLVEKMEDLVIASASITGYAFDPSNDLLRKT